MRTFHDLVHSRFAGLVILAIALAAMSTTPANATPGSRSPGIGGLAQPIRQPSAEVAANCAWRRVAAPSPGGIVQLLGVGALTKSDIWAVGSQAGGGRPLILHYNGTSWAEQAGPAPLSGVLAAVSATARDDVWAVGSYFASKAAHLRSLIEHYDGTAWKIVPSPNFASGDTILKGVVALGAKDVWAVGGNGRPGNRAILLHFNGSKWSIVSTPALPKEGDLLSVDRSGQRGANVIAVGRLGALADPEPLVLRYNGSVWRREQVTAGGNNGKELRGVSGSIGAASFAVGTQSKSALRTLAMAPSQGGWGAEPSANLGSGINVLQAVSAGGAARATYGFAVGYRETPTFVRRTLIEAPVDATNGRHWLAVPSPNVGSGHNDLHGVVTLSPQNAWAVGTTTKPIGSDALVLHYAC